MTEKVRLTKDLFIDACLEIQREKTEARKKKEKEQYKDYCDNFDRQKQLEEKHSK